MLPQFHAHRTIINHTTPHHHTMPNKATQNIESNIEFDSTSASSIQTHTTQNMENETDKLMINLHV